MLQAGELRILQHPHGLLSSQILCLAHCVGYGLHPGLEVRRYVL